MSSKGPFNPVTTAAAPRNAVEALIMNFWKLIDKPPMINPKTTMSTTCVAVSTRGGKLIAASSVSARTETCPPETCRYEPNTMPINAPIADPEIKMVT